MKKLVGLITAWGAEPFIEPAIKQALEYCDEVVVSVGLHMPQLKEFEDKTMDVCLKYKNDIKLIPSILSGGYVESRSATLKNMLDSTNNNIKNNWIFILDADEFYFKEDIDLCKEVMKENIFNRILTPEKTFMVNTKHYINWGRDRFKKLLVDNMSFRNNELGYEKQSLPFSLKTENGMFHYTFLMNPKAKEIFWKNEYNSSESIDTQNKIYWLNEIYMKINLKNQKESVEKSINKFNINSIMGVIFAGGPWKPTKENGELYYYNGIHPKFIEDAGLTKINDFRTYYNN